MTAPLEHFPVVVVGSGPVGLTLANLLGRYGVPTLLVEKNTTTVQEPRAVSIDDESLRTMQAAGIVGDVLQNVVPGYGSRYLGPDRRQFASVEPTASPYGFPRRNAFRQPLLEATLRESLARFGHVAALYGCKLVNYEQSTSGVTLQVLGASGLMAVSCDYLVGCDGASSTVRDQLGIRLGGTTFDERWLIVDLENHDNRSKHTDVFCDRRRPCITLPGPSRTRRYEFKLLPGERDEDLLDGRTVQRLLQDHGADAVATIVRKVVYRFHARVAERWSEGRVFIAGDAAHLTPPFAGQGMNSGIRDAMNLAWKLAAVVTGVASPGLLDSYETERKPHAWEMIRLALRMGRVMSPRSALSGFLTRTGFRALKVWPPAYDYVAQMKYKPKPRFHSGFVVPDGRSARRTLVGHLVPQPVLSTTADEAALLDEFLGNQFMLVARTSDPIGTFARFDQPVWQRLRAGRLAIVPPGQIPGPCQDIGYAVDTGDSLLEYGDSVLLVRPDRYVAAVMQPSEAGRFADEIEGLLNPG